jgi:hypothetical protein
MEEDFRRDLIEAFEDVKEAVRKAEGRSRAGLMLGLQELGSHPQGWVGGYYTIDSNLIVMNSTALRRIRETEPALFKPYAFHVLLHEYVHSLGFRDEEETGRMTFEITRAACGDGHPATEMARDMRPFIPRFVYPDFGWMPRTAAPIDLVKGFDRGSYQNYIT